MVSTGRTPSLHCGQSNSNGGDLGRLGAARVTVIRAGGARNQDATRSVDQGVAGRGARSDGFAAQHMVVHVGVVVMHGSKTCVLIVCQSRLLVGVRDRERSGTSFAVTAEYVFVLGSSNDADNYSVRS
jgi:hypothetical protein